MGMYASGEKVACVHGLAWSHVVNVDALLDAVKQPGDPSLVGVICQLPLILSVVGGLGLQGAQVDRLGQSLPGCGPWHPGVQHTWA